VKPIESKIIHLLYVFYKLIVLYLKVFKFHQFFAGLYKKFKKQLSCCHDKHDVTTRARVQCWHIYEYFILKQCLENVGVGLLHACISSYENICADKIIVDI
jgi:hypothetical protein